MSAVARPTIPASLAAMTSPSQTLVVEVATERLLRVALLFGLAASIVALLTTLQAAAPVSTVLLAFAWSAAWAAGAAKPDAVVGLLRRWHWSVPVVVGLSIVTTLASGGFDSLLKAEANWLAWAAPVVLGTSASLVIAALLSTGLLTAFLLDGMSLHDVVAGADRYTAVTDIFNPFVVVLVSLTVTGVFRAVLGGASASLLRARQGGPASSPGMSRLLVGRPVLALPAGSIAPGSQPRELAGLVGPEIQLSQAEREIVDLLAVGHTPQQIALRRQRSAETVYDQIASAKSKAGARTIEHLIVRAWRPPS